MIKKTFFGLSALLLLTACGGSSSSSETKTDTDKLKERDGIVIFYNYPSNICESDELLNEMKTVSGTKNHLIVVASNNVTCTTYGKNSTTCSTEDIGGTGGKSCVVGFDLSSTNKQLKSSVVGQIEDIKNSMVIAAD